MSKSFRIVAALLVGAAAYGACFLVDAHAARHTSWPRYLALALMAGVVMLGAEALSKRITRHDRTTDPLGPRLRRLTALLALAMVVFLALWFIARHS